MLDFIIIGAAKSGTSWLATNLRRNPDCFIPKQEIHYFSRFYETQSPQWYSAFFDARLPHQSAGERSNTYMTDPLAAQRINRHFPDIKLPVILRNPVERAYSGYCMRFERGLVSANIEKELNPDNPGTYELLHNGLYSVQLNRFLDYFPKEQIHVSIHEDILTRPEELLNGIGSFIGIPNKFDIQSIRTRYNSKRNESIPPILKRSLKPILRSETMRRKVGEIVRSSLVGRTLLRLASNTIVYPAFTPEIREKLTSYYADEVKLISRLIGRPLDEWTDK